MKLLVVGSRSIKDFDLKPYIMPEVDTIISGGASGVDSLAEQYADLHRISKYIIRPRYDLYGRLLSCRSRGRLRLKCGLLYRCLHQ